jgi:hypothetical protein
MLKICLPQHIVPIHRREAWEALGRHQTQGENHGAAYPNWVSHHIRTEVPSPSGVLVGFPNSFLLTDGHQLQGNQNRLDFAHKITKSEKEITVRVLARIEKMSPNCENEG